MDTPAEPRDEDVSARISRLMLRDQRDLQRRLGGARSRRRGGGVAPESMEERIAAAERRIEGRRAAVPTIGYPAELPVSQAKHEILAAIRDHQVVIVAGETGSGKTTQIPKICLELGRGIVGTIGHTQPRRIAARSVADRIAEELGTTIGASVGYKIRFTDHSSDDTLVKVMTDGILLAELQNDRSLWQYDTLIIDEAHERSLNIDFILGYLKQLLPRRPDLKVVITSATIDPQRFAAHFDNAPIVEVSGRTYPVEVRYRPFDDDGDVDQIQAISNAVEELWTEGPGDVLVFLSGEREIRDTADALRSMQLPDTEILPLYARLSSAEQHRVFDAHGGRRVVLATNVAETSLTVPGIRYVVDPGTARISRYSHRLKVQRLPIEPVSQASANQRKGRCGRLSDGICIRLYSADDFTARPEFTDPEIVRTNLASVILQMTSLGLGDVGAFPFVDPPDRRNVRDGIQLLEELGAFEPGKTDPRKQLTSIGRQLAQLPVDPRLARMVVEADRNGCVHEVLVIAAALSIQDPRERPLEKQQAADQSHARFADPTSDFLAFLNLWNYLHDQQRALSSSAFRRLCKAEFLHYLRMREWQDLYGQLRSAARGIGIHPGDERATPQRVHVSVLAGLLSHIGMRDVEKKDYLGARGARFAVFPGSALYRKPPRFAMAAELVETSRLWGRIVARIEPEWVEPLAAHLVTRTYNEPHWEARHGAVVAYEKVTLYGVPLVSARKVTYSEVDPELCRELFIRHALVEGDWRTHHAFFAHNRALLDEIEALEHRARRRDLVISDDEIFAFYDEHIPADVVSGRHFDTWWKTERRARPDLLTFSREMLTAGNAVADNEYPDTWPYGDLQLELRYQFDPGADADGVTVLIRLEVLNRVEPQAFEWQIPALRDDLVTALIRSLPKSIRTSVVPAPNYAKAARERMTPYAEPITSVLARELTALAGIVVLASDFSIDRIPPHLRMMFRVVTADGHSLAEGLDLGALKEQLRPRVQATVSRVAASIERAQVPSWDFGQLPRTFEETREGHRIVGYPALVAEGNAVALRVLPTATEQNDAMRRGLRRLLLLNVASPTKSVLSSLPNATKLALTHAPHPTPTALFADCAECAVDAVVLARGGLIWTEAEWTELLTAVRSGLQLATAAVVTDVAQVLAAAQDVGSRLGSASSLALLPALTDLKDQLARLVYPGFVTETGSGRLRDVVRYVQAMGRRLDKLASDPGRDHLGLGAVQHVEQAYADLVAGLRPEARRTEAVQQIRWMIEELRVSLFAQTIKTAYPVSEKRVLRAIDQLR
ncbi:MAG: ATP-dependent RNA helicase HrpA [Mycobacteriales bacterium]